MQTRQAGLFSCVSVPNARKGRRGLSRSDYLGQVARHCWTELTKAQICAGARFNYATREQRAHPRSPRQSRDLIASCVFLMTRACAAHCCLDFRAFVAPRRCRRDRDRPIPPLGLAPNIIFGPLGDEATPEMGDGAEQVKDEFVGGRRYVDFLFQAQQRDPAFFETVASSSASVSFGSNFPCRITAVYSQSGATFSRSRAGAWLRPSPDPFRPLCLRGRRPCRSRGQVGCERRARALRGVCACVRLRGNVGIILWTIRFDPSGHEVRIQKSARIRPGATF